MPDSKISIPRNRRDAAPASRVPADADWLALVTEKVNTLDYGIVQIVVHDGRVVQVERTERHRFEVRAKANG